MDKQGYFFTTKISQAKTGSYSTVIPKAIINKFGLKKGQQLGWDIDTPFTIKITPELPEEASIEAGNQIFKDMFLNGNTAPYTEALATIKARLTDPDTSKEEKVKSLVMEYNQIPDKDGFKQVVLYLIDYPIPDIDNPDQYEIMEKVYNQITSTG